MEAYRSQGIRWRYEWFVRGAWSLVTGIVDPALPPPESFFPRASFPEWALGYVSSVLARGLPDPRPAWAAASGLAIQDPAAPPPLTGNALLPPGALAASSGGTQDAQGLAPQPHAPLGVGQVAAGPGPWGASARAPRWGDGLQANSLMVESEGGDSQGGTQEEESEEEGPEGEPEGELEGGCEGAGARPRSEERRQAPLAPLAPPWPPWALRTSWTSLPTSSPWMTPSASPLRPRPPGSGSLLRRPFGRAWRTSRSI